MVEPARLPAPALPPQQRGDAACLTLMMAQVFGDKPPPAKSYEPPAIQDDDPIFVVQA